MFGYQVALQGAGNENAVINAISTAAASAPYDRLRGAYAYATAAGALLLTSRLSSAMVEWTRADKRWLISLDWGHSEPEALELLASLPYSEVRIPNATQVLASNLVPRLCFHPKTLLLDQAARRDRPPAVLALGSANMTASGLRFGYEHVAVATWGRGATSSSARLELAAMQAEALRLETVWRRSRKVDRKLIADYKGLRDRVRARPRRAQESPEDSSAKVLQLEQTIHLGFARVAELRAARNLWVEVRRVNENRGPGIPGNQIEFTAGARAFFGLDATKVPLNSPLGTVRIEYTGIAYERNMRFGHNSMDKLDLPIPGTEGPVTYENTVLRFVRRPDGAFGLTVGSPNDITRWRAASDAAGTSYRLVGGRAWGVLG